MLLNEWTVQVREPLHKCANTTYELSVESLEIHMLFHFLSIYI